MEAYKATCALNRFYCKGACWGRERRAEGLGFSRVLPRWVVSISLGTSGQNPECGGGYWKTQWQAPAFLSPSLGREVP